MSEELKACPGCDGTGGWVRNGQPTECLICDGSGRIISSLRYDTLRYELVAMTAMVEKAEAVCKAVEFQIDDDGGDFLYVMVVNAFTDWKEAKP